MSLSPQLTARQLEQAFETFNRVSVELDTSYRVLQERVAGLTVELAKARSERLRELAEKERLANRLGSLMEALPCGLVVLDANGVVQESNPEACAMLGQELANRSWSDIQKCLSKPTPDNPGTRQLADGRRLNIIQRSLTTASATKASAANDSDSGADERVILLTDVTEIHELQEQVSREKRLVATGEVAARLAHQIRTPISSALLYTPHLTRVDISDLERERVAARVMDRLRHTEQLVNSMLTFMRGGHSGTELLPLADVFNTVVDMAEPQLAANTGRVELGEVADVMVPGNREALTSALLNLVNNGLEAAGQHVEANQIAVIRLGGRVSGDRVEISVQDNGPGVPRDLRDRIFDPFYTGRAKGTGLGLTVVAMIAKSHGGEVKVEDGTGGGARFCLVLPLQSGCGQQDPGAGLWGSGGK